MTSRFAALIHCQFHEPGRLTVPGCSIAAAIIMAVALFLVTSVNAGAQPVPECSGISAVSLTASVDAEMQAGSFTTAADCGFSVELGPLPPDRPADAEACVVTATPRTMTSTSAGVGITTTGDCDGVELRWSVYPQPQSDQALAFSSGQSAAYAYLLGEDAVGIDMIKNWARATWTHTVDQVLTVTESQELWGTTHEIHILGLYLGDGWTIEYSDFGEFRHSGDRVEAWSIGYFHNDLPLFPDPRARTRSELHTGANGAFYCRFVLLWINNYGFTSESECAQS